MGVYMQLMYKEGGVPCDGYGTMLLREDYGAFVRSWALVGASYDMVGSCSRGLMYP